MMRKFRFRVTYVCDGWMRAIFRTVVAENLEKAEMLLDVWLPPRALSSRRRTVTLLKSEG